MLSWRVFFSIRRFHLIGIRARAADAQMESELLLYFFV
jgi:hypothetical protein